MSNQRAVWIAAAAAIGAALVVPVWNWIERPRQYEKVTVTHFVCVVKAAGLDNPQGACDDSRGDKRVQAGGGEQEVRIPVQPSLIPPQSKISSTVEVAGGNNFGMLRPVSARYEEGVIFAKVNPNSTGGFNDKLTFTLYYTK